MSDQPKISQEEADKKTAELNVKIYSTEELEERTKVATARRIAAFKKFLLDVVNSEKAGLIDQMDEAELAEGYASPINELFAYAEENGLTVNDFKAIKKNILQLGLVFERIETTADRYKEQLMFSLTGENKYEDLPIRKVEDLITAMKK